MQENILKVFSISDFFASAKDEVLFLIFFAIKINLNCFLIKLNNKSNENLLMF